MLSCGPRDLVPWNSGPIKKSGFRPSWEKVLTYCNSFLFLTSTVLLTTTQVSQPVQCSTAYANETTKTVDTNFVTSACSSKVNSPWRFIGGWVTVASLVIFYWYSSWEWFTVVASRFSSIKEVDKLIQEKSLTKRNVETLGLKYDEIRNICCTLYFDKYCRPSLSELYLLRNAIGSVALIITATFIWIWCPTSSKRANPFNCTLDEKERAAVGISEFLCYNTLAEVGFACLIISTCLLVAMFAATVIGVGFAIPHAIDTKVVPKLSECGNLLVRDYAFVQMFSGYTTFTLGGSTKVTLPAMNRRVLKKLEGSLTEAIDGGDKDFLRMYWSLVSEGKGNVRNEIGRAEDGGTEKLTELLKDFPDLFEMCLSDGHLKMFIHLHSILFKDAGISYVYSGCCGETKFSKEILKNSDFYVPLRKSQQPMMMRHILSRAQLTPKEIEDLQEYGTFPKDKGLHDLNLDELVKVIENAYGIDLTPPLRSPHFRDITENSSRATTAVFDTAQLIKIQGSVINIQAGASIAGESQKILRGFDKRRTKLRRQPLPASSTETKALINQGKEPHTVVNVDDSIDDEDAAVANS